EQCITFINTYIPPSISTDGYNQLFEYLETTLDYSTPIIITGDFNIPELADCTNGLKSTNLFGTYFNFITLNNLTQYNSVTNSNSRILDLILASENLLLKVKKHSYPLVSEDDHHPCLHFDVNFQCTINDQF